MRPARRRGNKGATSRVFALWLLASALVTLILVVWAAPLDAAGPAATVTVQLSSPMVVADGVSTVTATATVTDAGGFPVAGDSVTITSSDPGETITPSPATDNGDGTYTATITSSTTVGVVTITATDSTGPSGSAELTQTPGPATSVGVALSSPTIIANGSSTTTATASVTDANGNAVVGDDVSFSSNDGAEMIGPVTDNGNGTYSATITSSTTVGSMTITATDSSVSPAVSGQATLTQVAGSMTALLPASPSTAVTNLAVTLIATVAATAGSPSGTIAFDVGSAPVAGCASEPVAATGSTAVATCQASFPASTSPEQLTAVFTPANPTSLLASTSTAVSLAVGLAPTTTLLQLSADKLTVGTSATYTATIIPGYAGASEPSGSVEFLDGGTPISSCASQPLTAGPTSSTATCTVKYSAARTHAISARYLADENFASSSSSAQSVTVARKVVTVLKSVATTMQWTFLHATSYSKILSLVVNGAPLGGRLTVNCSGGGCPYATRVIAVAKRKACASTSSHRCNAQSSHALNLAPAFHDRQLRIGTRVVIKVVKSGWVGKYYKFTIRAGAAPAVQISCLAPGESAPGVGC